MTTLTATYLQPDDTPCSGSVTFELSAAVFDSDQPAIRPQVRLVETLDGNGQISVDLMPYDDPGLTLVGTLSYRVTERIQGAPVRTYFVAVPLDANPVDLGTLAPQGTPGTVTSLRLIPAGGTTGQVLAKDTNTDYDVEWVDQTGGGGGTVAGFPFATYTWKAASQSTDPGTGCIGVNNNTPSSATIMRVSATDADATDLHYGWQMLREGDSVTVVDDNDDTKGYRFLVDGLVTDNTTWLSIPIQPAVILAGGEPADLADVKVLVYPTGGEVTSVDGNTGAIDLSSTYAAASHNHAAYIAASTVDAKGDLLVGTAADTVGRLAVGTNEYVLTADSAQSSGLRWAIAPAQPINAQTGTTYTIVLGDVGKLVTCSNSSAITVTLPQDSDVAVPTGSRIDFLVISTGMVTFAAGSGATVNATPSAVTRAQWSAATAVKRAANTWTVIGDLA